MAVSSPNMVLRIWNSSLDPYSSDELADNFARIDQHDHSLGRGVQVPTAGIADGAITSAKIAPGVTVAPGPGSVGNAALAPGAVDLANLTTSLVQYLMPTGTVLPYGGTAAPTGYVLCNGAPYDAVTNPQYVPLWNILGVTFGGTGQSSFKVPDVMGRVVAGRAAAGHADMATLGWTESQNLTGLAVGSRRVKHQHSFTLNTNTTGAHIHSFQGHDPSHTNGVAGTQVPHFDAFNTDSTFWPTDSQGNHSHTISGSVGTGSAPTDVVPYLVLNYIIKL
jgi:microcystin-dependent protein